MLLNAKLDGKRKVGRPRLGWIDDIQADLRKIDVTSWRKKAIDKWRILINSCIAFHLSIILITYQI